MIAAITAFIVSALLTFSLFVSHEWRAAINAGILVMCAFFIVTAVFF